MKEKSKTFEEAMAELEEIVEKLEKGELPIDESIEYFQKGVELSRYCSKKLDEAEKKITLLIEEENGDIREEIFEYESHINWEENTKIIKSTSEANNGI